MKQLFLTITAVLFLFACGNGADSHSKCEEECKKEKCEHGDKKKCEKGDKECTKKCGDKHGDKKCDKDCKKKCGSKGKEGSKCEEGCKKECCSKKESNMEIGTLNPSLEASMKDISGADMKMANLAKENGTLIIFSCNTCPFVVGRGENTEGWQNRYNDIQKMADELNIGFALVNSNEGKRENEDSFENMVSHAKDNGYNNIKYLMDVNSVVADAFNAKTTPHVYLFDKDNKLVYTGAIDDNVDKKAEVKEAWLSDAMTSLSKGEEIAKPVSKNMGCSIKRVKKEEAHGHDHEHGKGEDHNH